MILYLSCNQNRISNWRAIHCTIFEIIRFIVIVQKNYKEFLFYFASPIHSNVVVYVHFSYWSLLNDFIADGTRSSGSKLPKAKASFYIVLMAWVHDWSLISMGWLDSPTTTFSWCSLLFRDLVLHWIAAVLSSWIIEHGALTSQRNGSITVQKLVVVLEGEWW